MRSRSLAWGSLAGAVVLLALGARNEAACTFSWSMETETPEVCAKGSDDTPYYYPPGKTFRTDKEAHGGKHSLDLSGQKWRQATFDNPTNNHVWASPEQGAIVLHFKYTGKFGAGMLMQITGKSKDKKLDTNDGIGIRFKGDSELRLGYGWNGARESTSIAYKHGKPFAADTWYKVTAKWNTAKEPHLYLQVDDGKPVTGGVKPGATEAKAWHHLLWGNDTPTSPEGLFLDDVEVWDDFEMTRGGSESAPATTSGPAR